MAVGDSCVFPGLFTSVLTQLVFPKPLTTFLTCFSRGERRKYAGEKSRPLTGDRSCNHQVMSPTCSSLNHPGGAESIRRQQNKCELKMEISLLGRIEKIKGNGGIAGSL